MWIRIQKWKRKNGETVLRAQVAHSYRDPGSRRPKTKILVHLGSIPAADCSNVKARLIFWLKSEKALSASGLNQTQKATARRLLSKKITKARLSLPLSP
jgi:hypothetical protein